MSAPKTEFSSRNPSREIYQIKISLSHIKPPVWRRVAVPGNITLAKLSNVIMDVMGWSGYHLHDFRYHDLVFGVPDPEFDSLRIIDERRAKLNEVIRESGRRMTYTYDFGDNWEHVIKVERVLDPDPDTTYPICLAGRRACPPEDCGGRGDTKIP